MIERLSRALHGGHDVPVQKQRERFDRLRPLIAEALRLADEGFADDSRSAKEPYRIAAHFEKGRLIGSAQWPEGSALAQLLR